MYQYNRKVPKIGLPVSLYNPFLADERILLKAAQIFTSLVPRPLMQYTQLSVVEDHGKGTNFSLPVAQALLIYITTDQGCLHAARGCRA